MVVEIYFNPKFQAQEDRVVDSNTLNLDPDPEFWLN